MLSLILCPSLDLQITTSLLYFIPVTLSSSDQDTRDRLSAYSSVISALTRSPSIDVTSDGSPPTRCAKTNAHQNVDVYLNLQVSIKCNLDSVPLCALKHMFICWTLCFCMFKFQCPKVVPRTPIMSHMMIVQLPEPIHSHRKAYS